MVLRYVQLAPSHTAGAAERVAQWAHTEIRVSAARDERKAEIPRKIGEAEGIRTLDLRIVNRAAAEHAGRIVRKGLKSRGKLVERKGIEPSTFALRTRRSPS